MNTEKKTMEVDVTKGFTVVYFPWESLSGYPRVAGRFKTVKEKDDFISKIFAPNSGWLDEELQTVSVINDYNYALER